MFSNKKTSPTTSGQEGSSLNHHALFPKEAALYFLGQICQLPSTLTSYPLVGQVQAREMLTP
jgi:hypothetical protein